MQVRAFRHLSVEDGFDFIIVCEYIFRLEGLESKDMKEPAASLDNKEKAAEAPDDGDEQTYVDTDDRPSNTFKSMSCTT